MVSPKEHANLGPDPTSFISFIQPPVTSGASTGPAAGSGAFSPLFELTDFPCFH